MGSLRAALLAPAAPVRLADLPTGATPGFSGGRHAAVAALRRLGPQVADLQERLYAQGKTGGRRSVLVVLQGMDTAGKGGVLRHSVGLVDPQGVRIRAFAAPTPAERRHDFLWRVRRALPEPGYLGIFDRSHYEDVLIARVRGLVPASTWSRRYETINRFEHDLTEAGTTILKCFLHISRDKQWKRLRRRLDDPTKHWKYDPADVDERTRWDAYVTAYEAVLDRCNTGYAPWYVIPSDHKWYRNWAVTELLRETLADLDLGWPAAAFDVDLERTRLDATR